MQSIDSTEVYKYNMSKDVIHVKETIKSYNIIQRYITNIYRLYLYSRYITKIYHKFDYITKKDIKNIIQVGQKFLTIHIEY